MSKKNHELIVLRNELNILRKRVLDLEKRIIPPCERPMLPEDSIIHEKQVVVCKNKLTIWFDGGKRFSGNCYGSYQISFNGDLKDIVRLDLPDAGTSNQAELATLRNALHDAILTTQGEVAVTDLLVCGDSKLAIFTSSGKWNAKHENVVPLAYENRLMLEKFGQFADRWTPRERMVERFGH